MNLKEVKNWLARRDSQDAFWIGNCIGIAALLVTLLVVAPAKQRERLEYEAHQFALHKTKAPNNNAPAVVCAACAMKSGQVLAAQSVVLKQVEGISPANHYLFRTEAATGKKLVAPVQAGQPILESEIEQGQSN